MAKLKLFFYSSNCFSSSAAHIFKNTLKRNLLENYRS